MAMNAIEHDPVERWHAARRRVVRIGGLCCVIAMGVMVWLAVRTNGADVRGAGRGVEHTRDERETVRAFDARVFDVALWTPPPAPVVKDVIAAPPPPPPPLKYQLLGISGDGGGDGPRRAALYDPETDRVVLIAQGESVSGFVVRTLTHDAIEFVDGTRVERLSLREPASTPTAGGGTR